VLYLAATMGFALQPPERVNYQGRLIEGTNLVNGSRQIIFRLFDEVSAGIELYGETQTVSVVDGLYSTAIGLSNTVAGSLLAALKGSSCFLEVEIGGTVLSPREEIAAVAHALTAVSKAGDTMTGPLTINAGAGEGILILSEGSGIAIGNSASAEGGEERIAIGHNVTNEVDHTAAVRGTLYLDGGTNIYYRSTAGTGPWQELMVEEDPVWLSEKGAYATGSPVYAEADPVWTAEREAYATGTPLYVFTETDPVWTAEKAAYATGMPVYAEADPVWIAEKAGYATGTPLYTYTETDPSWASSSNDVEIRILNIETARVSKIGDEMTGALVINVSSVTGIVIGSSGANIAIGNAANVAGGGLAVGDRANAAVNGTALGYMAFGAYVGTALGRTANGSSSGASVGQAANSFQSGAAIGFEADGSSWGAAMGRGANAKNSGISIGHFSHGREYAVAIGRDSYAVQTNISIGYAAKCWAGRNRIAMGSGVVNDTDDSAQIRGSLYLDGGTGLMYRSTFGSGAWSVKAFTIDHPLDPENRVLRHYSVEGPEVWNVYAGNAQVIGGTAVVDLPAYYSALNLAGSEVYSFTPVGIPAVCYVKQKASGNRFVIGADQDCEVSWTVKAVRNDPAAREDLLHRPVEQLKADIRSFPPISEAEQQNTTAISP